MSFKIGPTSLDGGGALDACVHQGLVKIPLLDKICFQSLARNGFKSFVTFCNLLEFLAQIEN
jgi:hypothetical protein